MSIHLLKTIYDSLKVHFREPAKVREVTFSEADRLRMQRCAAERSGFDTRNLKAEVLADQSTFAHYKLNETADLLVVGDTKPSSRLLQVMAKVLSAMGTENHYTIQWFLSPAERKFPAPNKEIEAIHINGGYCMPCDPSTIVIYRREDALRVLIHELFHATCLDDHKKDMPIIEAETEAWAEILYAMIGALEHRLTPEAAWRIQSGWAAAQNRRLEAEHSIDGPRDYAWRYTVGKEEFWRYMGLPVAAPSARTDSLQLGAPRLDIS